jgi:ATP-binding cassette subfamily B (MDR/TAP) protein 1
MSDPMGSAVPEDMKAAEKDLEQQPIEEADRKGTKEALDEKRPVSGPHSSGSSDSDSTRPDLKKYDSKIAEARKELEGDEAFAHLPEHERDILKRQVHVPVASVTFKQLYRYATTWDKVFVVIAAICAIGGGAVMPLMTVVFGNLAGSFKGLVLGTIDVSTFPGLLSHYTLYFVYLAIGEFILIYFATVLFIYTGDHITAKIRQQYLAAILRQNIGFFDKLGAGEVTTRITADTNLIQTAISEKVGLTLTGVVRCGRHSGGGGSEFDQKHHCFRHPG